MPREAIDFGDPVSAEVPMVEGVYRGTLRRETRVTRYRFGLRRTRRRWVLRVPGGIPCWFRDGPGGDAAGRLYRAEGETADDAIANAVFAVVAARAAAGGGADPPSRPPDGAPPAHESGKFFS